MFFTASTIIILPFQFAFSTDLERDVPILLLSALSDLFFLVDILVNFRTGYIDSRGNLDADPKRAARRYLRTWFCPDALAAAFPLDLINASIVSMRAALEGLKEGKPPPELSLPFSELQEVVGFPEYYEEERRYRV